MTDIYEDDIDAETLQAQIDMSMAFTENLVASWMKSSKGKLPSAKSRRQDEERELEEYMRRPPRLGVGAAIPETTSAFGRDTARLKNKLAGSSKKRAREDERDAAKAESDNDEESRAGAIKKKAKLDPFAKVMAPKQKKAKASADSPPATVKVEEAVKQEERVSSEDATHDIHAADNTVKREEIDSPRKKKKKKKKAAELAAASSSSQKPISALSTTSADAQEVETILSTPGPSILSSPKKIATVSDSTPKGKTVTVFTAITPPSSEVKHEEDATPRRVSSPRTPISYVKTEASLLNLDGPPQDERVDGEASPKKKRKRKKKKKVHGDSHGHEDVIDEDENT